MSFKRRVVINKTRPKNETKPNKRKPHDLNVGKPTTKDKKGKIEKSFNCWMHLFLPLPLTQIANKKAGSSPEKLHRQNKNALRS